MEGVKDVSAEQVESPHCSSPVGCFGDPQVLPRIGDEYQADIPPLAAEYDCLDIIRIPADSEALVDLSNTFSLGLPIKWKDYEVEKLKGKIALSNANSELKVKPISTVFGAVKDVEELSSLQPTVGSDLVLPLEPNVKSWSQTQEDSFLLGLYIFGKNFKPVKRFVENKEIQDILPFYYGNFYASDGYRRWSQNRKLTKESSKLKGRNCIHGQKIITGWRQKELLSRLFARVSKECQDMLMESSTYFVEGKISSEEYIFKLKDIVGIDMLIEAVGLGKGKQDLTSFALEPTKSNIVISFRSQVPIGKACASLTSADIIKFLTGDFRISKARSKDLFWEAVWPRLLAKGWHSEQRMLSLVFLVPGIKKYSRSLVKGIQYFDSVSDVLKNVASDPGVLEIDNEAVKGTEDREVKSELPETQDMDDFPNKQHKQYLLLRSVNGSRDQKMFTIVDTCILRGAKQPKVGELRSLPVHTSSLSTPSSLFSESEQETYENSGDNAEETPTSISDEDMIDNGAFVDSSDGVTSESNAGMPDTADPTLLEVENHECQNTSLLSNNNQETQTETQSTSLPDDNCPSETMKCKFIWKLKPGHFKLGPAMKPRNLTDGENISIDCKPTQEEFHSQSNFPSECQGMKQEEDPQHLLRASSREKGSPTRNEDDATENFLDRVAAPEKSQPSILIDLNFPPSLPDFDFDEPVIDRMQTNDTSTENKSSFLPETSKQPEPVKLPEVEASTEEELAVKSQRPARNRPLTTKAWEALELDFLRSKQRKRKGETLQVKSKSNSQRARGST